MSKVLVVEDNPDNMALLDEILDDAGYEMLQAINAEIGIELLDSTQVDLILMDISLPQMSGLEATAIIKANDKTKHIPIIALTAHAMSVDKENALSAGVNGFMTKPINEDELLAVIKETIK